MSVQDKRGFGATVCVAFLLIGATAFGAVLFKDDFEDGLDHWTPVAGEWELVQDKGNSSAATLEANAPLQFRTLNIADKEFSDFTMDARVWQVSRDHGANIYVRNTQSVDNLFHDGYWFGMSGALDAVGWGVYFGGIQSVLGVWYSKVPLDGWMTFRLTMTGSRAQFWAKRDGFDDELELLFDLTDLKEGIPFFNESGNVGFIVAGAEVWVDDVTITDDGNIRAVKAADRAAVTWGSLKGR